MENVSYTCGCPDPPLQLAFLPIPLQRAPKLFKAQVKQ